MRSDSITTSVGTGSDSKLRYRMGGNNQREIIHARVDRSPTANKTSYTLKSFNPGTGQLLLPFQSRLG